MFKKLLGLLSDSAIYGISGSLRRLVGLILVPLLGWYLSPAELGVMFMLSIVGMLFIPIAGLGMTNAIFRYFNLDKDPHHQGLVLSTGLASVVVSSLLLFALTQIFAPTISVRVIGEENATSLLRLTLVAGLANSIGTVFFVAQRAARQVKLAAAASIFQTLVHAGLTLTLVIGFDQGVRGTVIGSMVSALAGSTVAMLLTFNRFVLRVDWTTWRRMFDYGLPFVPSQLQIVALELFGLYMVRNMLGLEAAGIYGMATKFASPVSLVVNAVEASWVPYKFHIYAEDPDPKAFFRSAMIYFSAGITYLWLGAAIWGPELLRLLMPPTYESAASMIWATTLIPAMQGAYYMAGTGFELQNKTRAMPLVSFLGLVTIAISSYLLINPLGPLGAAVATVLAWTIMSLTIFILSQQRFPIAYDWTTIWGFIALASAGVALGYAAQGQSLAVRIALITTLSLIYPLLSTLILLRSREERNRVQHLLSKLRGV